MDATTADQQPVCRTQRLSRCRTSASEDRGGAVARCDALADGGATPVQGPRPLWQPMAATGHSMSFTRC